MALPALIGTWVASSLATGIGAIIARAFVALGIGYGTYNFVMPEFVNMVRGQLSGLPGHMLAVMGAAKVDVAITILFSAISARMATRVFFRRTG